MHYLLQQTFKIVLIDTNNFKSWCVFL